MNEKRYPKSWKGADLLSEAREIMALRADEFTDYGVAKIHYTPGNPIAYETPADELAKYADIVTCAFPDAAFEATSTAGADVLKMNLTAWGNLAFVSLHAVDPDNRSTAENTLCAWRAEARRINDKIKRNRKGKRSGN